MESQLSECAWEKCFGFLAFGFVNKSEDCFPARSVYVSTTVRNIEKFASIFIPTMSVFGIICNILNIYVLSRFRIKTCFHRLLLFLAVFDMFTLFCNFFFGGALNILQSELNDLCKNPNRYLNIFGNSTID